MTKHTSEGVDSDDGPETEPPHSQEATNVAVENFLQFLARMLAMKHLRSAVNDKKTEAAPPNLEIRKNSRRPRKMLKSGTTDYDA